MNKEKELLHKIIKNKEASKLTKEITELKQVLKDKQERLKEIKPTSTFNAG